MGNNQDFIIGIEENGGCKARRDMSIGSIRNAATVSAAVVSLLITACIAPEPVVERVEVTKVVNRSVEVPVTVLVTPTPPPATDGPSPAPTSPPIVSPSRSLTEATLEDMQVMFVNYGDHLRAKASPRFRLDAPDLDVFVDLDLAVDDNERCDTARVYWGREEPKVICDLAFRSHTTVQRISLRAPQGDFQCERADYSDAYATYFHCVRSSTENTLEDIGIHFMNYGDNLRAYADPYFSLDVPDLDIFVDVSLVVDDGERCDTVRIYWGTGEPEVICDLAFRSHTTVQHVSLQTPQGNLRCERDEFSDALFTSFSCTRADNPARGNGSPDQTSTCAPSGELTFENRPPQGGTLVRLDADPPTLDPHLSNDLSSTLIVQEVFGGLVTLSLDHQPVLDLAANCRINEDGTVYTFSLRDNARFQDGKPVTAHDVKWSIERAADPMTLSPTAYDDLGDILGVIDKLEGRTDEVQGVRVVNDRTVEIEIYAPDSSFLAKLASEVAFVLDEDQVADDGSWLASPNGTGPFRLGDYQSGRLIILEANPLYHLGPPHLDNVRMILDGQDAMSMYENDLIHLTGVGLYDLPLILDPNHPLNGELHRSPPDFEVFYIGLNVMEPPFDDPEVRQALNYAIDLQSIADDVLGGRVSPARGVIPPGFPSYTDDLRSYEYNPGLARELMQSSTYADELSSGNFPTLVLTISDSPGARVPAYLQAILEQWRQELGIEVSVRQVPWTGFLQGLGQRKYQMFSMGWIAYYPDPSSFLDRLFHSNSSNNQTGYSNPEVDRLLDEARVEWNRERRFRIYNRVEQMVLDDAPWVWMWFSGEDYALIKPEVSGYFLTQMPVSKYRYVYFSEHTEVR